MRRFVAFLVILLVPLQFTWAAVLGVHGHASGEVAAAGVHLHGHDHDHDHADAHDHGGQTQHAAEPQHAADTQPANGDDGHHSHTHPVFSSLLADFGLVLAEAVPGGPILQPPTGFLSRTPPPLDRPPLTRA